MVHTDSIPHEMLTSIAEQIGKRLPSILNPEALMGVDIELAETFQVWMVGAESITKLGRNAPALDMLVQRTDRWHHQITFNGQATVIGRSYYDQSLANCRLAELFVSPLAAKIQHAITSIDHGAIAARNCLVRLLNAPAYQMHALWLYDERKRASQIMVIDSPEEFREFRFDEPVNAGEFIVALSHTPLVSGYTHNFG